MVWLMSSCPKTANVLTRHAALHTPLPVAPVMKSMPHITCRLCFLSRGQKHQRCIGAYDKSAPSLLRRSSGVRPAIVRRSSGGSLALGAEIGAAQHRFHQCLGLLKKHPSKIPPARPISTSIYASQNATKSTSIYTTICATISRSAETDVLCSDRQNPVLRPVPGSKNPEGAQGVKGWPLSRPPRSGAEPRTAGPSPASMASVLDGRAHEGKIDEKEG